MVKLAEATLTSQSQISIPKKVTQRLHIEKGDKVAFFEDKAGHIVLEEVEHAVEFSSREWEEFLAKTKKEPVTRLKGREQALQHLDRLMKKK